MRKVVLLIVRALRPFANMLYALLKMRSVQNKITFITRQSSDTPLDFSLLIQELKRQDSTLKIVVLCHPVASGIAGSFGYIPRLFEQMVHISNSKVVVLDGYVPTVSFLAQRKSLYVLQLWHALGAIKRFSYQALDTVGGRSSDVARVLRMHANYSEVLCGSESSRSIFAEAFDVRMDQIRVLPLPRVDVLRAPDINRLDAIVDAHPSLAGQSTMVLYAPTFRDDANDASFVHALDSLSLACDNAGCTLVVKAHPRMNANQQNARGSVIFSELSTVDLINLADHVITDYSAVAFEAAVAAKPLWFFIYDIEEYISRRGLNIDPREVMGQSCFNHAEELIAALESCSVPTIEQLTFCEYYILSQDAQPLHSATKAIVRRIREESSR